MDEQLRVAAATEPAPKTENVEFWTFVSQHGVTVSYMLRIERGERGKILLNAIDNTPVAVELTLHDDTDKNELIAQMCFPIVNCFHYSCARGKHTTYAEGQSPRDKELKRIQEIAAADLLKRRGRMTRPSVESNEKTATE